MTSRYVKPPREVVEEMRRFANRELSREEFDAWVNAPMSDDEREEIESLIDWFTRRFPTPAERMASARRSYKAAEARAPYPFK